MKRMSIWILLTVMFIPLMAQSAADASSMAMRVLVEEPIEPFPATAKTQLETKLNALLLKNGVVAMDYLGQFFITVRVIPTTKDVLPGPPMQISERMDFIFYIADYYSHIVYSTTSMSAIGVGTTEAKCYLDAIKKLNINSSTLADFISEGKTKILEYYNTQADRIFLQARTLAKRHEYEQALYLVQSIPAECSRYSDAIAAGNEIFQQYIDYNCDVNLNEARMIWMSGQNAIAADNAGVYLAGIYPEAKCYGDAQKLYQEMKAKVHEDWKFEMKKYQDGVDLERARIASWREVGVAYGKGQQPTTTNIGFLH